MGEHVKGQLAALHRGQQITVIYNGRLEQQQLRITGKVVLIDNFWNILQVNQIGIDFSEIQKILI